LNIAEAVFIRMAEKM